MMTHPTRIFAVWCVFMLPLLSQASRIKITQSNQDDKQVAAQKRKTPTSVEDGVASKESKEETDNQGGFFSGLVPDIYHGCQEETADFGMLDRWITVTPDVPGTTKLKSWVSPSAWQQTVEQALGVADEEKPILPFEPFVFRHKRQYQGNVLAQIVTVTDDQHCHATIEVQCEDDKLQIVKQSACTNMTTDTAHDSAPAKTLPKKESTTREVWHLSSLSNSVKQCSFTTTANFWRSAKKQTVSVARNSLEELPDGHCIYISTLDPSSGISLGKLDADLMGSGFKNLAKDTTKMQRLVDNIATELNGIAAGLKKTAEGVVEGGRDVVSVVGDLQDDMHSGSKSAGEKSVKWIKRLTLDSEVETCLCCDQPTIDVHDTMAAHCMVAYTLGGQNTNSTLKHSFKTISGTLYNLCQTAGNWLVPFLGANVVQKSHEATCQFVCDLRQPHLYEQYEHAKIRQVPGLAMQTWFIPNPKSFFSTATAASATEAVVEQAGTSVATNVVTEVVDAAV